MLSEQGENLEVNLVEAASTCAVNSDTEGRTVDETHRFTGRHGTTYDETKARAHDYVEQFAAAHDAPEIVIVMPGGIYGPGDTSQIGQMLADVAAGKRVMVSSSLRIAVEVPSQPLKSPTTRTAVACGAHTANEVPSIPSWLR